MTAKDIIANAELAIELPEDSEERRRLLRLAYKTDSPASIVKLVENLLPKARNDSELRFYQLIIIDAAISIASRDSVNELKLPKSTFPSYESDSWNQSLSNTVADWLHWSSNFTKVGSGQRQ